VFCFTEKSCVDGTSDRKKLVRRQKVKSCKEMQRNAMKIGEKVKVKVDLGFLRVRGKHPGTSVT
jgi:hypothetical protein